MSKNSAKKNYQSCMEWVSFRNQLSKSKKVLRFDPLSKMYTLRYN